jgi:hypothetical protein
MTDERRLRLTGASSPATAGRIASRLKSGVRVSTRMKFTADRPARISLRADDGPIPMEASGRISTDGPIRLCVVPDDLCFESDYELALDVLDEPRVATFFVRGRTEITTCRETPTRRICVDFADLPEGRTVSGPMVVGGVTFGPLGDPLRTADLGDPAGQVKLAFPPTGLRVEFPEPVEHVVARVNQYAGSQLTFVAYPAEGEPSRFTRRLNNAVKSVSIIVEGLKAFEVIGGQNESSLIDVCFESSWPAVAPLRRENERRHPDG